jgi:transposase-like protein
MNTFVGKTIETLMLLERDEYLEEINDPKKDKGNGHYNRSLKSLSKNSLLVSIPQTRSGLFSPATLELLKINR